MNMRAYRSLFTYSTAILVVLLLSNTGKTQTGSFKITFTPQNGSKAITLQFSQPLLKFDNPHGYWFINPHSGDRHLQFKPDAGYGDRAADVAFITFNEKANDFDFYDGSGKDLIDKAIANIDFTALTELISKQQ